MFKADYVGKRAVSHYDVYKQNKTGELLLRRKILMNLLEQELVAMMRNNLIEVIFYMESNASII